MSMQLDPHVKATFDEIVAHTPEIGPTPSNDLLRLTPEPKRSSRRGLAAAAAAIAAVGIGGLLVLQSATSDSPVVAPATQPPSPTSPAPTPQGAAGFLAPTPLPDGYILYDTPSIDADTIEGSREFIYGPADAAPGDIVEIIAGDNVAGIPCEPSGDTVAIGDAVVCAPAEGDFRTQAAQQLLWTTSTGTPVALLAGTNVKPVEMVAIANAVVINAPAGQPRLTGDDLTVTTLPDGWTRLGHPGDTPLVAATAYEIGSATDPAAPTYLVHIYARTKPEDIWSIMHGRHSSTPVTVRGTTGYLENSDEFNPFLVWQEADGLIVHVQNNGGTPDSILAFAESLAPLDGDARQAFLQLAQDRPAPPEPPADGIATTTTAIEQG